MKKTAVLICALLCLLPCSIGCVAAKEEPAETTFVFKVDVNERYTDIIDATEDEEFYKIYNNENEEKQAQTRRNTYIAVLVSALVVSVIVLVVSLKRVPKEDEIMLESENKNGKNKE